MISRLPSPRAWTRPVVALAAYVLALCSPPPPEHEIHIPVEHETLFLAPLRGVESLRNLPHWPNSSAGHKAIMSELDGFYQQMLAHVHRCEKYGLFRVVDSMGGPTVVVRPAIRPGAITADSLPIVIEMTVEHLAAGRTYSYAADAVARAKGETLNDSNALSFYGLAFADFRRRAPYADLAAPFCGRR
jgi:hypothetical protein